MPPATPSPPRPKGGCLVCGAALVYLDATEPMTCAGCGEVHPSATRCSAGHFLCDACHSGDARDVIERHCRAAPGVDPVAIALGAMRHPKVQMHGPEHHFLVAAALLAAHANAQGDAAGKGERISEARRRSDPVRGGFCGFQGACGAAIGAGIFVSVVTGATPYARESWGLANRATSRALDAIGRTGGPRCCKRTTWLALLTAVRLANEHLGVKLTARGPACEFTAENRECLERECPFHRASGSRTDPR